MTLTPAEQQRVQELFDEYRALCHAMQSGVAQEMELNDAHTPKHLRVGVNSAMVEHSVLVKLLIDKGILTTVEWAEALRDGMRREVEAYEKRLSRHYGVKVHLA